MSPLKSSIKKVSRHALYIALLGLSLNAFANNGHEPAISVVSANDSLASTGDGRTAANTAEVRNISNKAGESLINVVYANPSGSRFSVSVIDGEGNQLFQAVFSDKRFDRKFKVADPEVFDHLVFIIRNFGDNTLQRFEVKTNNRLVEDIEVKEVK